MSRINRPFIPERGTYAWIYQKDSTVIVKIFQNREIRQVLNIHNDMRLYKNRPEYKSLLASFRSYENKPANGIIVPYEQLGELVTSRIPVNQLMPEPPRVEEALPPFPEEPEPMAQHPTAQPTANEIIAVLLDKAEADKTTIAELRNTIHDQSVEINGLREEAADRDERITELEAKVHELEDQLTTPSPVEEISAENLDRYDALFTDGTR